MSEMLSDSQKVSQHLRRVEFIGQSVPHGNLGILCQFLHDGLHPAVYHVKMADFLKEYLDSGLNVRVWTVNEKEDMEWLIRAGVTAIITNYPDKAVQIKEKVEA